MSEQYTELGAIVGTRENIFEIVQDLKNGKYENTAVFVNRYDGLIYPTIVADF